MNTITSRYRLLALLSLLPVVSSCQAIKGAVFSKGQANKTADLRSVRSSENAGDALPKNTEHILSPDAKSESQRVQIAQSSSFVDPSAPNPSEVTINSFTYAGSGCGAGTAATNLSADKKALTVLFSQFMASVGPGVDPLLSRRNCQINIDLQAPAGFGYSLVTLDTRGAVTLEPSVSGTLRATYHFQSSQEDRVFEHVLTGPLDEDFVVRDQAAVETDVPETYLWSSCEGASRSLTINSVIEMDNGLNPLASGVMTVDSIDGELTHQYGIKWRKCEPVPAPTPAPTPAPPAPIDNSANLSLNTSIALLSVYHPGCYGSYNRSIELSCRAAVRRLCATYGYPGGMLVEYDSVVNAQVICLRGELKTPSVSTLTSYHPNCSGASGPVAVLACDSAATALCGPSFPAAFLQEYNAATNSAAVVCVGAAAAEPAIPSIATLSQYHPVCSGPWNLDSSSLACNAAFSRYCASLGRGFKSGFISNYDSANASGGACVR